MKQTPRLNIAISKYRQGFSIPELIIVMTIMIGLYLLITANIFSPQRSNMMETTIDTLIADISTQQNKSMSGDISTGTTNTSYGIYFQPNQYTLFKGISNGSGSEHFSVSLNPNITFSAINVPSSEVVFATSSGVFQGYVSGQDTVVIQDTAAGISKTIHINSFGVVDNVY